MTIGAIANSFRFPSIFGLFVSDLLFNYIAFVVDYDLAYPAIVHSINLNGTLAVYCGPSTKGFRKLWLLVLRVFPPKARYYNSHKL